MLDKAVCWTAGSSPIIPSSEVHIDSTLLLSDDPGIAHLVARTELARIEETIYFEAYASQSKSRTKPQVIRLAYGIHRRLQDWLDNLGIDLDQAESSTEYPISKIELAIDFLCTRLLLIWPFKGHPDAMFLQGQNIARSCIKLLLRLWNSPPDQIHYAMSPLYVLTATLLVDSTSNLYETDLMVSSLVSQHLIPHYISTRYAQLFLKDKENLRTWICFRSLHRCFWLSTVLEKKAVSADDFIRCHAS